MEIQIYDQLGNKLNTYGKKKIIFPKVRKGWQEIPAYISTKGLDTNEEEY